MKLTICMGSKCVMMGAMNILDQVEDLKERMGYEDLQVETVVCMKYCKNKEHHSPIVMIDGEVMTDATTERVMEKIMQTYQNAM